MFGNWFGGTKKRRPRKSNPRKPRARDKAGRFLPARCTRGTKQGWRARRVKGPGKYAPGSCRKHPSRPAPRRRGAR